MEWRSGPCWVPADREGWPIVMSAVAIRDGAASDAATILAQPDLASQHASGAVILAGRGDPWRLTFASAAAANAFRADSLAALESILLSLDQPGAARLAALAQTTPADRPPRLERLRFFLNGRARTMDFQCRTVGRGPGDGLFVAVGLGSGGDGRGQPGADLVWAAARSSPAGSTADPGAATPRTAPHDTIARPGTLVSGHVRFVWATGPGHIVERISPELADSVGQGNALEPGMSLADRVQELDADPQARLRDALAAQETFVGVELSWPVGEAGSRAPVALAGQPIFGEARRLLGHRGFGLVRLAPETESPPQSAGTIVDRPAELDGSALQDKVPPASSCAPEPSGAAPDPPDFPLDDRRTGAADETTPVADAPARGALPPDAAPVDETAAVSAEASPVQTPFAAGNTGTIVAPQQPPTQSREEAQRSAAPALSTSETDAFDELATLLQARLTDDGSAEPAGLPAPDPLPLRMPDDPLPPGPDARGASTDRDLAAVMERLPIGVLIARDGGGLYANRTFLDLLGYTDLDAFTRAGGLDRTLRGREAEAFERGGALALVTADGDVLEVDGNLKPVVWGGAPATLLAIRRSLEVEIARRLGPLREELAAREKEAAELGATLDTATDGVAVLDSKGLIASLNRSAEALFGIELSDVVGESFATLLAPESHATARDYLDGLMRNGVASVLNDGREVVGRAGMRGVIPLFMTIGPLRHEGEPRFCVVLRDLTPWKRAERDLQEARHAAERASQLKSDFLARVSHEVRTPLNAILGFAEVMMEERFGPVGNERYKEYLRDIHASGVHVMSIVNDLLDLSKIEAGKMELTFASVDANKVVADCVALMQPQAHRERVVIRMALSPRLPNIVADDRSLRQIILNILSNAVSFNEPGGQVIVSTALTDIGAAVLRVRDTGIGMNDSDIEAALEPFRQLPTARKGTGTGTGLGLPLTKALADANRAAFTIKSRKNEGTLVEIAFPPARVLSG